MQIPRMLIVLVGLLLISCSQNSKNPNKTGGEQPDILFSKIDRSVSNLDFVNVFLQDEEFNFLNYPYIYTGAGVAVGDINNDGLLDIYMVSNFENNKLFLNKGDMVFQDITTSANVKGTAGFSTGVTMIDVNNDGFLDIYVCKAGSLKNDALRSNLLYVNNQDGTFKEDAKKWGLNDAGYSTQAYSFDYDKDGDLDLYLVNYRYDFQNNTKINSAIQAAIQPETSDQLYRNDGNVFTNVTDLAGVANKAWGLSAAIGDFNEDGWDDIYVANDFLEPDFLYINQKDGTFKDEILNTFKHISFYSMGSDFEDLNNDLKPDLYTVDMLAESYTRSKQNMASMSIDNFNNMVRVGYHHAYMANMLQFNLGKGKFQEASQLSGVMKTDWSWAPLIADFDNDGHKDIFVSNGIIKDYTNQDFRTEIQKKIHKNEPMTLADIDSMLPSEKLPNYIFKNNGDATFNKMIDDWGLNDPNFSNGAAYADFDNDGDLDLVVNNHDDYMSLYQNNAVLNYLTLKLVGPASNIQAIGTKVTIVSDTLKQTKRLFTSRGYESAVTSEMHFGLGDIEEVDEVFIDWPDGTRSILENVKANQRLKISYDNSGKSASKFENSNTKKIVLDADELGISYRHSNNSYDDYTDQLLLPQRQSTKGASIAVADINGDGLDDLFIGNAAGNPAVTYVQMNNGKFVKTNSLLWKEEEQYEDADALFFDFDGDNDMDLYVVSTGYEFGYNEELLQDRLYLNDGDGNFRKSRNVVPKRAVSGSCVTAADFDSDGDLDLFVGGASIPGKYPLGSDSALFVNEDGVFIEISNSGDTFKSLGLISDAGFVDIDGDKDLDLVTVGEWNTPQLLINDKNNFSNKTTESLKEYAGWWFSLIYHDFDKDGDEDFLIGNLGRNNKFHPKVDSPMHIYSKDFDANGSYDIALSKMNNGMQVPVRGKECSSQQNPYLLDKIKTYKEFTELEILDIYGEKQMEGANRLSVNNFASSYMESIGDGSFKIVSLPMGAQFGPTMAFETADVNNDGYTDIIGVGGLYDAEVETIRYDANFGYVLLNDKTGSFKVSKEYQPEIDSDAKAIVKIKIGDTLYFIVVSNNKALDIFRFAT